MRVEARRFIFKRHTKGLHGGYISGMTIPGASQERRRRPEISDDLKDVAHQLHQEFDGRLDPREVDDSLTRLSAKFNDAKVRSFVPLLVRRYVRDDLLRRLERTTLEVEMG